VLHKGDLKLCLSKGGKNLRVEEQSKKLGILTGEAFEDLSFF
jgi:hypothetical protein